MLATRAPRVDRQPVLRQSSDPAGDGDVPNSEGRFRRGRMVPRQPALTVSGRMDCVKLLLRIFKLPVRPVDGVFPIQDRKPPLAAPNRSIGLVSGRKSFQNFFEKIFGEREVRVRKC